VGKIRGHLSFFNEKVDLEVDLEVDLGVDGEEQGRPRTQWS